MCSVLHSSQQPESRAFFKPNFEPETLNSKLLMSNEKIRTKQELKNLFTNLRRKSITDDMISILIDALWRDKQLQRTAGFYSAGGWDAEIAFDANSRIFSIKPFDPLVEGFEPRYMVFSWTTEAHFHRIFDTHEIEIPNEEGLFFVYFDKEPDPGRNLILFVKKNPTEQEIREIFLTKAMIASLYWDATNDELLCFGNDKHGSEWNPQIQWFIHNTLGAQVKNGLQFIDYSINQDGSLNNHAKFIISEGEFLHDDIDIEIPTSSNSIPVLYKFGDFPRFINNNGYAFAGAGRIYYNSGQISLAQADSGNYVLYHIFATNEILTANRKIISVMGVAQYPTLAEAYQGVKPELDAIVTYMPHQGKCYLGSVVFQTSDDYTNDVKIRIVAFAGEKQHPPVTIHPDSEEFLSISENQVLSINTEALPGGDAGIPDAPADGKQYARKDEQWTEVVSSFTVFDLPFEFCVAAGVAQTFVIDLYAVYPYTINSLIAESDGALTGVAVKIDGTNVTGLSSVSISTLAETNASGSNTVALTKRVTIITSTGYSGTPTYLRGKIKITRL